MDLQPFKCEECNQRFKKEGVRDRHVKEHFTAFRCTRCEKDFPRKDALDKHIQQDHPQQKKKKCPWCGNRFAEGKACEDHVLKECNKRPGGNKQRKK
jgi:uncharacterized Zn-finger protein